MTVLLLLVACSLLYLILWKVIDMSKTVDDLVDLLPQLATAVNALEAVITDLKSKLPDPADQAKLDGALQSVKDILADATDGTDEAATPAP